MGKIGVFDSGYGGLTVLESLRKKLPQYDFLYYGDNIRAPYGTRTFDEVYNYTLSAVKELISMDCPLIILACNTASAKALRSIQQNYLIKYAPEKRVLGVIRPSAEILGQLSKSHHIGLLATIGTVNSNSYQIELQKFSPHSKLYQYACSNWVSLIESDTWNTQQGHKEIIYDLKNLLTLSDQMDIILLACTHFPILARFLRENIPNNIRIISQGDIVATSLIDYLQRHKEIDKRLTKNTKVEYYTTGDANIFNLQAKKLLTLNVQSIHRPFLL